MSEDPQSIFRQESLERLSTPEQLDQLMQIVNSKSWLPLAALGSLLALGIGWSIFGRIPVTATGQGVLVHPASSAAGLVGLAYFDSEEASQIQPGMTIRLTPTGDQTRSISAQVQSISAAPIQTIAAARQAQAQTGLRPSPIEVLANLPTSGTVPPPGTVVTAEVTLAERAPIAFVFPFLESR